MTRFLEKRKCSCMSVSQTMSSKLITFLAFLKRRGNFLGLFKCFELFPRATNLPVRAFFNRSNHFGTLRHFLLLRAFFTCNRSATSRHFHTAIILFLAPFFRAWYLCPF